MSERVDVALLVLRADIDGGDRYLLARRSTDGAWEFVGGKREDGESIREAARRELDEELAAVAPTDARILDVGEPYPSVFGAEYVLTPVLVDLPGSVAADLDDGDLSHEHTTMTWVDLDEFDEYETRGQYPALETLGLVDDADG